ncbi:MAG: hypothetical protein C0404_07165 [Verrucomicrobia bacterium]|nr:hypothetical protein [Verrucomicrobiota bacterium]
MKTSLLSCVVCSVAVSVALGAPVTLYVEPGTPTHGESGTQLDPFHSIQDAINAAATNDPGSSNHVIRVGGGTYAHGLQENFSTNFANGDRWSGLGEAVNSKSLINIYSTNGYLNGLQLVGAGVGKSIIDAKYADGVGRVMYVSNNTVRVQGFTLTGGQCGPRAGGAAMLIHGSYCTFQDLLITTNRTTGANTYHIVCTAAGPGTAMAPPHNLTFRNIEIMGNYGDNAADSSRVALALVKTYSNLIANVSIHANIGMHGIMFDNPDDTYVGTVVFGCLVAGNSLYGTGNPWSGCGIIGGRSYNYFVNNTVAVNGNNGYFNGGLALGNILVNNIFYQDIGGITNAPAGSGARAYYLANNVINEAGFHWDNNSEATDGYPYPGNTGSNNTNAQPQFFNAPVSVDTTTANAPDASTVKVTSTARYSVGEYIEANRDRVARQVTAKPDGTTLTVTPGFPSNLGLGCLVRQWGSNNTNLVANYACRPAGDGLDRGGLMRTNAVSGFLYVDVDNSGGYMAGRDIIVGPGNYTPSPSDWVVATDIAGGPRLKLSGIDAGAYEYRPSIGTVIVLR